MKFTVILAICLVLMGCLNLVTPDHLRSSPLHRKAAAIASDLPPAGERTGFQGTAEAGVVSSATGCALQYRLYRPAHPATEALVVVGHGFLRSQERMVDLAQALADAGIPTVTLDYCNARFWDGRHFRNGLDMVRVADALDVDRVVYAGFSAGGLAAVVAGRSDPRTLGVVALDLVDATQLGEGMAAGLDRPLIGLVGDPSPCNADNNGLAVFAATDQAVVERVDGAEHCDFESPTDWLCRLICTRAEPVGGVSPRRDIIEAATSAVLSLIGTEALGIEGTAKPSGDAASL